METDICPTEKYKNSNHLGPDLKMVRLARIDSCQHVHSTVTIAISDKERAILTAPLLQHIQRFIPIQCTMIPIFLLSFWYWTFVVPYEIQ